MAIDWGALIDKGAAPTLAAVGGWVGAALRLRERMGTVEKDFDALRLAVGKQISEFKDEQKKHLEKVESQFEKKLEELREEFEEYERSLGQFRASSTDFAKDAELAHFIEEQQRQWQTIQRTLGQIEGMLKTLR